MKTINKTSTPIKNWAVDDRPREKMLNKGESALSDSELLAILINNGNKDKSALGESAAQCFRARLHAWAWA